MGIKDKIEIYKRTHSPRHSIIGVGACTSNQSLEISPNRVTEQTLQVWRALPPRIRQDPSMLSFQMENERLHGSGGATDDESCAHDESFLEDDHSCEGSECIQLRALPNKQKQQHLGDDKSEISDCEAYHSDFDSNEKSKAIAAHVREKKKCKDRRKRVRIWKKSSLLVFWLFAAVVLMVNDEKHLMEKTLAVPHNATKYFVLPTNPTGDFKLKIFGTFNETNKFSNKSKNLLIVQPQISFLNLTSGNLEYTDMLDPWHIVLVAEELFNHAPVVWRNLTFKMTTEMLDQLKQSGIRSRLRIHTNVDTDLAIKLIYNPLIIDVRTGTILAGLILLLFYALLVWEVFQRTFVAIVCSILSVSVLATFNDRPNMQEMIQWMDMEMLTLLFCMMIIVGILTETGVFDYVSVVAFELSRGKIWPMIYALCGITCLVSGFLDNMTTVLLMTPVAIRLCEVMSLDPIPVLMGIVVHANIGGSLTPIGDPVSIIIYSNQFLARNGLTFAKFVKHTLPGVLLTAIQSCIYLRFVFRDMDSLRLNEPKEFKELRREIIVWQRAANSISSFSKDADLVHHALKKKVKSLKHTLRRKQRGLNSADAYVHTLEDLKLKYPIRNRTVLLQASCALLFVLICFFVQSVPQLRTLPLGWVSLLGVIILLIVLNRDDIDHLMHRIEWTTLLFFAAMLVMMECVERLGLFTWIGEITESIILFVNKENRLAMAIFIILWISALASSILDSIPVAAMMVRVVVSLVAKQSLDLPLQPLVWALTFGTSLGGNGTLYGASSNVISAGLAEQHGYKITFTKYLRTVFPMMLGQITVITGYLMIAHILLEWH